MSTPDLLAPYRGSLTTEQITVGMNAATANARRLAQDARLLLENQRWPTAASIAVLSIEESGKFVILRRFLTASTEEIKDLWKQYRFHTKKNVNWILPELVANGARRLDDFKPIVDDASNHPEILNTTKQMGFYTDYLDASHWSLPNEVVDHALAKNLVMTAESLLSERVVTIREQELWTEYWGPVRNKNPELIKQAVINWYAAMQAENLLPRGSNKMHTFMQDGLTINQTKQMRIKTEAEHNTHGIG